MSFSWEIKSVTLVLSKQIFLSIICHWLICTSKSFLKKFLSADMAKSKLDLYKIVFYKYHLP